MKSTQKYGINKRLRDRRLELDYSEKEASIRLGISRRKLYLIEYGYIKVKSPLKERIIRKYKLDAHFFDDDFNGYPTLIYDKPKKKKVRPKLSKFFQSWYFKVGALALMGGFIALSVVGLNSSMRLKNDAPSFYTTNFNNLKRTIINKQTDVNSFTHHLPDEKETTDENSFIRLINDDYYTMYKDYSELPEPYKFIYTSVNFFNHDEFLPYTFLKSSAVVNVKWEQMQLGDFLFDYETRICNGLARFHLYIYTILTFDPLIYFKTAYVSADVNIRTGATRFNLVEECMLDGNMMQIKKDNFAYYIYTYMFSEYWDDLFIATNRMFNEYYEKKKIDITYETFIDDLVSGSNNYDGFYVRTCKMAIWGSTLSIVFLALFVLSCLARFKRSKVSDNEEIEAITIAKPNTKNVTQSIEERKKSTPIRAGPPIGNTRTLPYNSWPFPVIPEIAVRIFTLIITLISSICLYNIFQGLLSNDIASALASFVLKSEISSLAGISAVLFFFVKLDIRQSKRNTFLINFIFFFAGLIFYIYILLIEFSFASSRLLSPYTYILNYLPGNIVWGILSLNLLSASLFSQPKFKRETKAKFIAYRCLVIIPITYLTISLVYSIGKKACGWSWPLAVSSLFISNAFIPTLFAILYCVFVYLYKVYTIKKYGRDNALIYQTGNRYYFIKNVVIASIIALIGIVDVVVGKCVPNNPLGLGSNCLIFATIPFVLLYHPHMGQRNKKWDIIFLILYILFMMLGFSLIISNITTYINAL